MHNISFFSFSEMIFILSSYAVVAVMIVIIIIISGVLLGVRSMSVWRKIYISMLPKDNAKFC